MKYETLHHEAKQIDHLIDDRMHSKGPFPQNELKQLILRNFPDLYVKSFGWHKIVFGVRSVGRKLVLKVGPKRSIENDHRAYKRVPESIRHQVFARIFWHTKYCLLQEYGFPAHVTPEQLARLRRIVYKYGIFDVKAENLRKFDETIKIIDANVTRIPLPTVLRKIDEAKPKLPKRLILFIKKITRLINDR